MKFWSRTSNSNLVFALLALALAAGCASRQKKKDEEISTIRLHMEVNPQMVRRNMQVSIVRAQPVLITVGESYVMHEGYLNRAEIIEANGVHNVRLQWLEICAKDIFKKYNLLDKEASFDRKVLRKSLEDSAKGIHELFSQGWDDGGKVKGFKKGLIPMLGYFIAHESHHRGSILLTLKQCGEKIPDAVKWGLWEWGK